jgi:hypothetical protein
LVSDPRGDLLVAVCRDIYRAKSQRLLMSWLIARSIAAVVLAADAQTAIMAIRLRAGL